MFAVCVPSLSDAGVPLQHAACLPCIAPLAALSGQILWAAPSCCLSFGISGGTAQKLHFSSSQYLQHQHNVQINIFIPAGVWQLACSCLLLEPRKSRMSFPDQAEADIIVAVQVAGFIWLQRRNYKERSTLKRKRSRGVCRFLVTVISAQKSSNHCQSKQCGRRQGHSRMGLRGDFCLWNSADCTGTGLMPVYKAV